TYRTELADDARLTAWVVRHAEALGAVGVCNLQFRVLGGVPRVFEVNPRFSGASGIRYRYGFNEPELAFDLLRLGRPVSQPALRPAVVLRYWDEIVLPGATFAGLRGRAAA
ncbi:MAG TPA: ATP-grasp domain-containing protein, partial [Gemmataceae bacterium]|nr:ATP-grasp domain-containing protein [Gemmataceae bacterium]